MFLYSVAFIKNINLKKINAASALPLLLISVNLLSYNINY